MSITKEQKEWLKSNLTKRLKNTTNISLNDFINMFNRKTKDYTNSRLINEMEEVFQTFCGEKNLDKDDLISIFIFANIDVEFIYTALIKWEKNPNQHTEDRYNLIWYK